MTLAPRRSSHARVRLGCPTVAISSAVFVVVDASTEATLQCYGAELVARKAGTPKPDLMSVAGLRGPPTRLQLDYGTLQPAIPPQPPPPEATIAPGWQEPQAEKPPGLPTSWGGIGADWVGGSA